jgi:hypothetical protein
MVEKEFPLTPHSPVRLTCNAGSQAMKPVLELPTKLPLERPFGPSKEAESWEHLQEAMEAAERQLTEERWEQREQAQLLDVIYGDFVTAFEREVCAQTDTPLRRRSNRGRAPRIRMVASSVSAATHLQSWHSLDRPLHWLHSWTMSVLRYIQAMGGSDSATTAEWLARDLEDCPAEFRSMPPLIGLHAQAKLLIKAMVRDERSGFSSASLNTTAFQSFYNHLESAIEEEKRQVRAGHLQAWRNWIREAGRSHKGWAHRWTGLKQHWQPVRAPPGADFSGRPLDMLQSERDRLGGIWECSEEPQEWFQAPAESATQLEPMAPELLQRAAGSFPRKTSQTFDGFHPRHYALLSLDQLSVVAGLLRLVERIGVLPKVLRAILAKLIPKHKALADTISYRSIGLMPSLYRLWSRARRGEARAWEQRNRSPILNHQGGGPSWRLSSSSR